MWPLSNSTWRFSSVELPSNRKIGSCAVLRGIYRANKVITAIDAHRINPVIRFAAQAASDIAVPRALVQFPERGSPISPDAVALSTAPLPPDIVAYLKLLD
jgi:hypothetical protein